MARTVRGMWPCCPQKVAICTNYSFFENGEIRIEVDMYNKLIEMTGLTEYSNNTYQNLVEIWKKLL